ncbi:MAG: hypothetical protein WKG00_18835 [Polyangiaceae bacterium]
MGGGGSGGAGGSGGEAPIEHAVSVYGDDQKPVALAALVVNDAAGAVIGSYQADDTGQANVEVPVDGSVTAFWTTDNGSQYVVAAYEPPEGPIRLEPAIGVLKSSFSMVQEPTGYSINLSNAWTFAEMPYLYFWSTCSKQDSSTPTGNPDLFVSNAGCTGLPIDVILVVQSTDNPLEIGWGALSLPVNPGTNSNVNVSSLSTDYALAQQSIDSIPSGATVASWARTTMGYAQMVFDHGLGYPGGPSLDGDDLWLPIDGAVFETRDTVSNDNAGTQVTIERRWKGDVAPDNSLLDIAEQPMVLVKPLDVASSQHPVATWENQSTSTPDCVSLRYFGYDGSTQTSYHATAPGGLTTLRLPDIPDALADYRPTDETLAGAGSEVVYFTSPETPGYGPCIDGTMRVARPEDTPGPHFISGGLLPSR